MHNRSGMCAVSRFRELRNQHVQFMKGENAW